MIYSLDLSKTLIKHIPFVLMLEPLFKCNLACSGCGRIREYKDVLDRKLTREECTRRPGRPLII